MYLVPLLLLGVALGLCGCDPKSTEDTGDDGGEGQLAGDCSDGVDNDLDAFFDCFDAGCAEASECEGTGSPVIEAVGFGCDDSAFWFDTTTSGITTSGVLNIYQTDSSSPWHEEHPINVTGAAPDGSWTALYLELESFFPDVQGLDYGSTTLYDCSDVTNMQSTLTYVIEVVSADESAADCVVWGNNPDAAPADDCTRITPDSIEKLR